MVYFPEIRNEMEQVLKMIDENRSILEKYFPDSGGPDKRITAEKLEGLAGDHLFDDYPRLFDIRKIDGHKIRAYFQDGATNYDFVSELHEAFPDIMETEREEYLEKVNEIRNNRNLESIVFS